MKHIYLILLLLLSLLILIQHTSAATCRPAKSGIELYLDHAPGKITGGQEFPVFLTIANNDNTTQPAAVYSYIYRGSKVYSKSRRSNLINLTLEAESSLSLELPNNATASPGPYKLKIILEYKTNKTKEITLPLNLTRNSLITENLEISFLRLDSSNPPKIIALINNSRDEAYDLRLLLESETYFSERELSLAPHQEARLEFPLKTQSYDNYFFLKLYHHEILVDISELILKNTTLKPDIARPFNLVQGSIILNTTTPIYSSSSEKSRGLAIYLLLAVSIILNLYLLSRKQLT